MNFLGDFFRPYGLTVLYVAVKHFSARGVLLADGQYDIARKGDGTPIARIRVMDQHWFGPDYALPPDGEMWSLLRPVGDIHDAAIALLDALRRHGWIGLDDLTSTEG